MKWGNTNCRRFSKMRSIEFATKPKRGNFTVKIIFFDVTIGSKNYTICKIDMRSIFPTDWGQPISLFTVTAKRKSRWPCDARGIHARIARDEIINLAARRFAPRLARKNKYAYMCPHILSTKTSLRALRTSYEITKEIVSVNYELRFLVNI